ncbi:ead/Ea22-like family protein [Klebsiella quasipneumoniae subsp. quasipneumoniae]|uniref:ead/Ea22-like family protein n=1 Tax=Klebsiella quasipneumoniae TaxID=1463165 RepID=UPI0022F0D1DB|nr:ead/Ea22-like family protein [Klebsiella quasipneumoniae]MDA5091671.1 ead/Ea22-like family protein [Klebsiella quasipneumoniae subsp. quasipneumoniae]
MNNELTAALATIEKCRELTNCPDGVDLQDWVKQLAAENVALKDCVVNHAPAVEHWNAWADPEDKIQNAPETPATDCIVAGIKAGGRVEGAHFVANRMLAAWDAGFIEDTAKNAADIARMILTSTEFMAGAPEGDFDRSFADGILEDIAQPLREGAK